MKGVQPLLRELATVTGLEGVGAGERVALK